jgi:alanyl-tRNA synthetase
VLDATVFYPTSGGQTFDTGCLRAGGQDLRVVQVEEDEAGRILHFLAEPTSVPEGAQVEGFIDVPRRHDHIQQHSGQHILSAAFWRLFEQPTLSFHMGEEVCSIDVAAASVSDERLDAAEDLANAIVQQDRPVEIHFVSPNQAQAMGVRKLPPGTKSELRLIDIFDFDLTACGGTHVRTTGQVGPIAIRHTEKVKQGVRIGFVCGQRAIRAARQDRQTLASVAATLSTHPWDVPQQVDHVVAEARRHRKSSEAWMEEAAELESAQMLGTATGDPKIVVKLFSDRDLGYVKLVAQKIVRNSAIAAVALLACSSASPVLVFAQTPGAGFDMGALLRQVVGQRGGRGGGTRDMAQGGVPTSEGLEDAMRALARSLQGRGIEAVG